MMTTKHETVGLSVEEAIKISKVICLEEWIDGKVERRVVILKRGETKEVTE